MPKVGDATSEYCGTSVRDDAALNAWLAKRPTETPPDKQSCGYTELWNAFKRITANASANEKTALYSGTAAKVYRLTVPGEASR